MQNHARFFNITALAAVIAVSYPFAAVAAWHDSSSQGEAMQTSQHGTMTVDRIRNLRQTTVSAKELLNADVQDVGNTVGNVRDLVLNADGTAVEYVLFEVPYPYMMTRATGAENGFVGFDDVQVEPGLGFHDYIRLREKAAPMEPEKLTIDRADAKTRLVSRILGDTVDFSGDTARYVQDILIDRKSGRITGYVVDKDPDSLFNAQPLLIPASEVKIAENGAVTTSAEFASLETIK